MDTLALSATELRCRQFIEDHLVDDCGLLYAYLNTRTWRPWTNDELRGCDTLPVYRAERGDPAGQLAYEDSLMATGEYAEAEVYRFLTTREPGALTAAAQAAAALLRVFYEGERYELGFLPKPHGGLRRAAYSHEISPDQYLKTIVGLRAFQPLAPASQQRTIARYLVAVADYFLHREFQHPYRERTLVNPETRPHCVSLYLPALQLATRLTGSEHYRAAMGRFDPVIEAVVAGQFEVNFNLCSLWIEGFHLALAEGHDDPRLAAAIRTVWERHLPLVDADGGGRHAERTPLRTSRVTRMAAVAPLVHRYHPNLDAPAVARRVLAAHPDPRRMTYFDIYDDRYLKPAHRYQVESLCETSISSWLVGYWRLRRDGLLVTEES